MKIKSESKKLFFLILLAIIVNLFFVNQAFQMDDISFVYLGRQISKDPLHPYSFNFNGLGKTGIATFMTDPVLPSVYYAIFIRIFGESETILHISFLLFTVSALLGMYFLSKRFTKKPFIATIALFVSPIFFVMSHNLMVDIPFLSFFLLSILFYLKGVDANNWNYLILSGIFVSMAVMTKYTGLILIPLLAGYAILKRKFNTTLILIFPLFTVFLWNWYTSYIYGIGHITEIATYIMKNTQDLSIIPYLIRSIVFLSSVGGAIIFPISLIIPLLLKKKYLQMFLLSFFLSLFMSIFLYIYSANFISGRYSILELALFTIFSSAGIYIILVMVKYLFPTVKSSFLSLIKFSQIQVDKTFLIIWVFGLFLFNILVITDSPRFIILLLAPLIMFYLNILTEELNLSPQKLNYFFVFTLLLTFLVSLGMAIDDYQLAYIYKNFVNNEVGKFNAGNKIWFAGHHSFQYYMESKGYEMLGVMSNAPKKGDIILKSRLMAPRPFSPELKNRITLISKIEFNSNLPIRLFNTDSHAGFYSHGAGFLPFSFSLSPLDTIEVYKVIK